MIEQQAFDEFQTDYIANMIIECIHKIDNDEHLKNYTKKHEMIAKFVMSQRDEVSEEVCLKLYERQIGEK